MDLPVWKFLCTAIVWDVIGAPAVRALAKLRHIPIQGPVAVLDVVDDAHVLRPALDHDDGHGVIPAKIPCGMHWKQWVIRYIAHPAVVEYCVNLVAVDSTIGHAPWLAFPDVLVGLRADAHGLLALLLQNGEPWVVAPVDFTQPCVVAGVAMNRT